MIFRRRWDGAPLERSHRWLLAGWLVVLVAGFGVARFLDPDSRGYGTHQRLGLPPCSFRLLFNLPCPSCGMTTAFSNFTRGRVVQSFRANPAGLLLATLCAVQVPWALVSVIRGRLWGVNEPSETAFAVLLTVVIAVCANWAVMLVEQFRH